MAVMDDLYTTMSLLQLFWYVPSTAEKWIRYEPPDWEADKKKAKQMFGWSELNLVKFGVAGLPLHWKVINIIVVFIPKILLWCLLVSAGFHFLMETSGIVDVIMNSLAMTFILGLDELIFAVLTTVPVKHMMENLEDFQLFSVEQHEHEEDEHLLARYHDEQIKTHWSKHFFKVLIPKRLMAVIAVTSIFTYKYYSSFCQQDERGGFVSQPVFVPAEISFNPLKFVFESLQRKKSTPFWSMPKV
jgi:hypothetical protein